MLDLSYYNNEIDSILWDVLGERSFLESDYEALVELVTKTFCECHLNANENDVKAITEILINCKFQKYYEYDNESEFNKVINPKQKRFS